MDSSRPQLGRFTRTEAPPDEPEMVGDGIERARRGWSFGGQLPRVFDKHVRRSIPGYEELHELCLALIADHPSPKRVLDLGCSTGALTRKLRQICGAAEVIGIDGEPGMIAEAYRSDPEGTYLCSDLTELEFGATDAAFALYVFQFIPEAKRAPLLSRIRASLEPGGFFVFAEKVKAESPAEAAAERHAYHAFKRAQGFSAAEILAKEESLEGILVPLTERDNELLLRSAGFQKVSKVFSELCFRAWLIQP